jgi:hypothetical protein
LQKVREPIAGCRRSIKVGARGKRDREGREAGIGSYIDR